MPCPVLFLPLAEASWALVPSGFKPGSEGQGKCSRTSAGLGAISRNKLGVRESPAGCGSPLRAAGLRASPSPSLSLGFLLCKEDNGLTGHLFMLRQ